MTGEETKSLSPRRSSRLRHETSLVTKKCWHKAAAGNEKNGKRVFKLILNWQKEILTLTKEVIEIAAANSISGRKIIELLLSRREDKVIMEDNVFEIANMSLLQEWQEDQVVVTNTIELSGKYFFTLD